MQKLLLGVKRQLGLLLHCTENIQTKVLREREKGINKEGKKGNIREGGEIAEFNKYFRYGSSKLAYPQETHFCS